MIKARPLTGTIPLSRSVMYRKEIGAIDRLKPRSSRAFQRVASDLNRQLMAVTALEREVANAAHKEPLLKPRLEKVSKAWRQLKEAARTLYAAEKKPDFFLIGRFESGQVHLNFCSRPVLRSACDACRDASC